MHSTVLRLPHERPQRPLAPYLGITVDFNKLYSLEDEMLEGALSLAPADPLEDPYGLLAGRIRPANPLVICEHLVGQRLYDLIGIGYGYLYCLSDRVIGALRKHAFTGWSTFPVQVRGLSGESPSGYHGFAVVGRAGPIDLNRSALVWRPPLLPGGARCQMRVGRYFDPVSWDGSDVFLSEGAGYIIVVEQVKEVLEAARVKNIAFQPLTEIEDLIATAAV